MKFVEKKQALELRQKGYSIKHIAETLGVAKSSVSTWVRGIQLTRQQYEELRASPYTSTAIEKRRKARLSSEARKRDVVVNQAMVEVTAINSRELWLMGVMLYWAEGGKTQRMVRFSNGDPEMIKIMMHFFRSICEVPEQKFRGYIHIHPYLDYKQAETYWSNIAEIPLEQFFKTYRNRNISSQNKKDTLPYGVMDIYVLDTKLFLKLSGWAKGIFRTY